MNRAIKELTRIVEMEGIDRKSGKEARLIALNTWVNDWVEEVKYSQSVIKNSLTSEDQDFIKYHLASKMGDKLMDYCIQVESVPNKVSAQVWALRR